MVTRERQDTLTTIDQRARYIDGLRLLASVLESNDEIPLPYDGSGSTMSIHFLSVADPREQLAAAARAFPVKWDKHVRESEKYGDYFDLEGQLAGLKLQLTAYRDDVCRRVVTGTREVTEKVKDPGKLAEVPEIEVTRTVEDVTWECGSLLAPRPVEASAPVALDGGQAGEGRAA